MVWPHPKGETPLQNYNASLTTSYMHEMSNASIMFENFHIMRIIPKYLNAKEIVKVTIKNMYEYISSIHNLMMPSRSDAIFLSDITSLAVTPQYKYLRMASNPFVYDGKL